MTFYRTDKLTLDQKRDLLRRAYAVADRWHVDVLDRQDFRRKPTQMTFAEALKLLTPQCHFVAIHRNSVGEDHLEFGFRTATEPEYFLFIYVPSRYKEQLLGSLEPLR